MTQPLFVDTGGWVAYFDKADNDHVTFKDCLSQAICGTDWLLHTSDYIIDETATFLRYHTSHATACIALDNFRDLEASGLLSCHSSITTFVDELRTSFVSTKIRNSRLPTVPLLFSAKPRISTMW